MAEDDKLEAEDPDTPIPDAEDTSEASLDSDPPVSVQVPSIVRTRGAIVSNLRAAFEQHGNNDTRTRPLSADSRGLVSNGRLSTFDADFARLKDAMTKEQTARNADKVRLAEQEEEIERLKAQLEGLESAGAHERDPADIEEQQDGDDEKEQDGEDEKEQLLSALHRARAQIESSEIEAAAMRTQFTELKKSIATNTRIESHEMTDSAFQGELGTLCYQLQDWAINRFRKTKIEGTAGDLAARMPEDVGPESGPRLLSLWMQWDASAKMVILQAAIMALLMPIFEDPMPFGLPPRAEWSEAIRAASRGLGELLDAQAYNRWRATTFDIICHSEAMSPFVHSAANRIVSQICTVLDTVTESTTSESQTDNLRNVVRRVIALSHSLRVQRAIYAVHLPAPGTAFDVQTMEDLSDQYEEGSEACSIRCAIFPMVSKPNGSGSGNVIFKARTSLIDI